MNSYEFMAGEKQFESSVTSEPDGWSVVIGEHKYDVTRLSGEQLNLCGLKGETIAVAIKTGSKYLVDIGGTVIELTELTEDSFSDGALDHDVPKDKLFAPMPGKIVKINVQVGDIVIDKQTLVIVEAMKMENPVQAKAGGKVKAVHFSEGDQVDVEQAIIELELE